MMKKLGVLIVVSLTCVVFVNGQNSSNSQPVSTDGKSVLGDESPLEKGAKPLYDLVHGFLDSVQKDNFIAANGDSKITYKEIQTYITNGTLSKLADRWQDMVSVFGGYAACIVVGLLFAIFMPIIGMFFCCCYCCCKRCGKAREKSDPKSAGCKRATFCLFLAIFATMMLTGGIVAIISNEVLHTKLQNSDNRGPVQYMKSGLSELADYAAKTTGELKSATTNKVTLTVNQIVATIKESANTTVEEVLKLINADSLLNQTEALGKDATSVFNALVEVNRTLNDLRGYKRDVLDPKVTAINDNITSTCASYSPSPPNCPTLQGVNQNFSALSDLDRELKKVEESLNITSLTSQARDEFNGVVQKVKGSINNSIADASNKAENIKTTLEDEISKLTETTENFADDLRNTSLKEIDKIDDYLRDYADYVWYGGIGLPCIIVLTSVLYYLGIMFGLCGQRPGHGAPCCNRGTGSNFLVSGVVWTYLLYWLLMYIVLILFLVGGPLYTNVCRNLNQGVENVEEFEPILKDVGIDVKKMLNYSSSSTFSIGKALSNCKKDMGLYSAIELQDKFDLDSVLDVSKVMDEIESMNITGITNIPNVTIVTKELKDALEDFANSSISPNVITSYETELNKTAIPDLNETIAKLKSTGLNDQAAIIESFRDVELKNFTLKMNDLKAAVSVLKGHTGLQGAVYNLTTSLEASQKKYNDQKNQLVQSGLDKTVKSIKDYVNGTIENVKNDVRYNIGNCNPVYDAVQKLSDSVCLVLLDPYNTFWFGLGWGIFFCIPSIIFALLLANMYQREEKFDKDLHKAKKESRQKQQERQDFDSPMMETYHDDNIPLTSRPNGGYAQSNNGAVNQGYYNDRRDDYHRGNQYRDDYRHDDYRGSRGDPYYRQGERDYPPPSYHDSRNYPSPGHHEAYPVLPTKQRY